MWIRGDYDMLKKMLTLTFFTFIAIGILFLPQRAFAQDVWVGNDDGSELYLISDTIHSPSENAVKVTVKYVRNGELDKVDLWSFGCFKGEWRYSTEKMRQRGITSRVIESGLSGRILNYCLDNLP